MDINRSALPRDINTGNVSVPTSLTPVTSVDSEVWLINVSNPTAGSLNFTVKDSAGNAIIPTVPIAANSETLAVYNGTGLPAAGGVSWQASGSGLIGCIRGRRVTGWVLSSSGYMTNSSN